MPLPGKGGPNPGMPLPGAGGWRHPIPGPQMTHLPMLPALDYQSMPLPGKGGPNPRMPLPGAGGWRHQLAMAFLPMPPALHQQSMPLPGTGGLYPTIAHATQRNRWLGESSFAFLALFHGIFRLILGVRPWGFGTPLVDAT